MFGGFQLQVESNRLCFGTIPFTELYDQFSQKTLIPCAINNERKHGDFHPVRSNPRLSLFSSFPAFDTGYMFLRV